MMSSTGKLIKQLENAEAFLKIEIFQIVSVLGICSTILYTPGMTNQWLKKQGLISIKELWVNIHYPATAR